MLPDGTVADLWFFGTTIFTINILTVTFKAALIADFWSVWTHLAFWGSVSLWFLFILCYGSLWPFLADAVTVSLFHSLSSLSFLARTYSSFLDARLVQSIAPLFDVLALEHSFPDYLPPSPLRCQIVRAFFSLSSSNRS